MNFNDVIRGDGAKICYQHGYRTFSQIEMDLHFKMIRHYGKGTEGTCANKECQKKIPKFLIHYETSGEPAYILCDDCKNKMNIQLETLQDTKLFNSVFSKQWYT